MHLGLWETISSIKSWILEWNIVLHCIYKYVMYFKTIVRTPVLSTVTHISHTWILMNKLFVARWVYFFDGCKGTKGFFICFNSGKFCLLNMYFIYMPIKQLVKNVSRYFSHVCILNCHFKLLNWILHLNGILSIILIVICYYDFILILLFTFTIII